MLKRYSFNERGISLIHSLHPVTTYLLVVILWCRRLNTYLSSDLDVACQCHSHSAVQSFSRMALEKLSASVTASVIVVINQCINTVGPRSSNSLVGLTTHHDGLLGDNAYLCGGHTLVLGNKDISLFHFKVLSLNRPWMQDLHSFHSL